MSANYNYKLTHRSNLAINRISEAFICCAGFAYALWYYPYSGDILGLCEHILPEIQRFCRFSEGAAHSQVCRTALIRRAIESSDPRGSNGGSDVEIRALGADLRSFEIG